MNYQIAENRKRFDSFTRGGIAYTPTWVHRQVGDAVYDISSDTFMVVMKAHWDLEVKSVSATGEPDAGRTPLHCGYEPPSALDQPPYRCPVPPWAAQAGISPWKFAQAMAELVKKDVTHGG